MWHLENNRLADLPFSLVDKLQENAKNDKEDKLLKWYLITIMEVLSNSPNPNEKDFAEKFLNSLNIINEWNSSDEYDIFNDTKAKLLSFKQGVKKDNNNSEWKLLEKWWSPDLEVIFNWTKSEIFKNAPKFLNVIFDEKLKKYESKLTLNQRNNIKIWITDKIIKSSILEVALNSFTWWINWIVKDIQDWEYVNAWEKITSWWNDILWFKEKIAA